MKIYELLDSPEKWTKGTLAKTNDGRFVNYDDPNATCWCLGGAISKCYPGEFQRISDLVINYLMCNEDYRYIASWNDSPNRKYEDVIKVAKTLDI